MSAMRDLQRESLVDGEYPFSLSDFERIAAITRDISGISLSETKATLVYSRLAKRLRALGLRSFDKYCELVCSEGGAEEQSIMLAALTTNVTRFYREPHHFEHLRDQVLAPALNDLRSGGRMRLWSSACSTGEEPYSMALTLLAVAPDAQRLNIRILATDIDPNVLATARAGLYRADAIEPIPAQLRDKYFKAARDGAETKWRASDDLRALITFNHLNLIGEWPMKGKFDAIFCRNVVIYFEEPTQNLVWSRFHTRLEPGGRLYVGHSERVEAPGFQSDGLTVYKLTSGARHE
ncbi:MAG: protein-glutamate O-methyltransferase CheR [Caulobacterales bacterium]